MSEKETGFTAMAGARAGGEIPEIGVGMLGYAFMGKAHTNAFKKIPYMMYPPPAIPRLVAICGRNEEAVAEAARRYGYARYYTDWHKMLEDEEVQLFDNGGPNDTHAEPSILAAQAGKHVLCEKPLARSAAEAKEMLDAVQKAGVKHMVAFNYRFVPAVRQIRNLIDSGALGQIYHFRAVYLQEWIMPHYGTPKIWRLDKKVAGSGALGDLGAHIIDLAHFLVGGIKSVAAMTRTFIEERPLPDGSGVGKVDVDDAFVAAIEFENGAIGTLESTRFAAGRKNYNCFEINAEKGSIRFNLERMNELEVFWVGEEPKETQGFHDALITESYHPWWENWWPHGHIIGWEHTFVHEITHFLDCIVNDKDVAPYGATFEDGYRAAVICDAILESAEARKQVDIKY
ncbi:MAG TPA: Gfo/Idh/MocA family oxidoreductase [Chloroflexi bacterium]|nr:Gfo/Idh/MocA family oxidoreductase [Chloroflexota bacterium]